MSAANPAITLASTLQSASLNRAPSPHHDINPSTTASRKVPVRPTSPSHNRTHKRTRSLSTNSNDSQRSSRSEIPLSALKPASRSTALPPLPDLRFEQSYLASLKGTETAWGVAFVTLRDQVLLPLAQGTLWTLALSGWRYWNKTAEFSGATVGGKVRRWWYGVNNWAIPESRRKGGEEMAGRIGEYYTGQFGSGGGD